MFSRRSNLIFIFLFAILAFLTTAPGTSFAEGLHIKHIVDGTTDSEHDFVVRLYTPSDTDHTGGGCSGVLIFKGRAIVTAKHCRLSKQTEYTNCAEPESCDWKKGAITRVIEHPSADLAIALLDPVETAPSAELAEKLPQTNDGPLVIIGHSRRHKTRLRGNAGKVCNYLLEAKLIDLALVFSKHPEAWARDIGKHATAETYFMDGSACLASTSILEQARSNPSGQTFQGIILPDSPDYSVNASEPGDSGGAILLDEKLLGVVSTSDDGTAKADGSPVTLYQLHVSIPAFRSWLYEAIAEEDPHPITEINGSSIENTPGSIANSATDGIAVSLPKQTSTSDGSGCMLSATSRPRFAFLLLVLFSLYLWLRTKKNRELVGLLLVLFSIVSCGKETPESDEPILIQTGLRHWEAPEIVLPLTVQKAQQAKEAYFLDIHNDYPVEERGKIPIEPSKAGFRGVYHFSYGMRGEVLSVKYERGGVLRESQAYGAAELKYSRSIDAKGTTITTVRFYGLHGEQKANIHGEHTLTAIRAKGATAIYVVNKDRVGDIRENAYGEAYAVYGINDDNLVTSAIYLDVAQEPRDEQLLMPFRLYLYDKNKYNNAVLLSENSIPKISDKTSYALRFDLLFDERGRETSFNVTDNEGHPFFVSTLGFARKTMRYDTTGDALETRLFGDDGEIIDASWGPGVLRFTTTKEGLVSTKTACDASGEPLSDILPAATVAYTYTERGDLATETFEDASGDAKPRQDGSYTVTYAYTKHGDLEEQRFLDASGDLVRSSFYDAAIIRRTLNSDGQETRKQCFDASEAPSISQLFGAARIDTDYDNNGSVIGLSYYDDKNKLVSTPLRGYAKKRYTLQDDGRLQAISYYDNQDKSVLIDAGFARSTLSYDAENRAKELAFLDISGKPAEASLLQGHPLAARVVFLYNKESPYPLLRFFGRNELLLEEISPDRENLAILRMLDRR